MNFKAIGNVSAVILGLLGTSVAFAVSGGTGTKFLEGVNTYTAGTALFVTEDFDFNVSANVELQPAEVAQVMAVAAASTKGSYAYTGQSLGGAVITCGEKSTIGTPPTLPTASTTAGDNGCAAAPATDPVGT